MKKSKILLFIFIILLLVCLDQGSKLIVSHYLTVGEDYISVTDLFEIRPKINASVIEEILQKTSLYSAKYYLLLALNIAKSVCETGLVCFGLFVLSRYFAPIKKRIFLPACCICLAVSAAISYTFDVLFWGGSLDFLCIRVEANQVSGHTHPVYRHFICDVKDIYLSLMLLCYFAVIICFLLDYVKAPKKKKEELARSFSKKLQSVKQFFIR